MAKTRISKKSLAAFPAEVSEQISAIGEDMGIKSFTYRQVPASHKFYTSEGDRFTAISREKVASVEMMSSDSLGALGVCYDLGKEFSLPVGSFLIHVWYYGGFFMTVYNVGLEALPEGAR